MLKEQEIFNNKLLDCDNLLEITDIYFNYIFKLFESIKVLILEVPEQYNNHLKNLVLSKERSRFLKKDYDNIVLSPALLAEIKSEGLKNKKLFYTALNENFINQSYSKKEAGIKSLKNLLVLKFNTKNNIEFFIEIIFKDNNFDFVSNMDKLEKITQVFAFAIDYHIAFVELKNINRMFEKSLSHILELLISLLELKDPYTFGHSSNVKRISMLIAEKFELDDITKNNIATAAILHDIGKIGISDIILQKPDILDDLEFDEIRKHPLKGAFLLAHIPSFKEIAKIIMQHHERYDGRGYPVGLAGKNISFEARIIAVADAYDAITSQRPYRNQLGQAEAIRIIKSESGRQFDTKVVDAFLEVFNDAKDKNNVFKKKPINVFKLANV